MKDQYQLCKNNDRSKNDPGSGTQTRLRDKRKQFNKNQQMKTPLKQSKEYIDDDNEDKVSEENSMGNMYQKLTPITDSRKSKMRGLFKDDNSDGPDDGLDDEEDRQNKHAYKAPPNMASFDVPNGTFTHDSIDNTPHLNDPRTANMYSRRFDNDESSNERMASLFEPKMF